MVAHPIRVPRDGYRGRNPKRVEERREFNEIALRCETFLNENFAKRNEGSRVYTYGEIASELRLDIEAVRHVMYGVDAGHNGITIHRIGGDGAGENG